MFDFREIGKQVSNWGRWGADDERGTVNLITPERVAAAAQLVKRGRSSISASRSTATVRSPVAAGSTRCG